ncbi:MAG: transport permease protein [Acidimicrobiia bacterium]|nr:MAG: transport permease protein [Acidimicrobiia bacterium]
MNEQTRSTASRVYDSAKHLPPIGPYLRETLFHLAFAYEKAKLDLRATHKETWLGRLWNVLNPLLLGAVYWLLVIVIFGRAGNLFDPDEFRVLAQILGGLFLFSLPSSALSLGARSIVGGGAFVLNTRLPRMILPLGSVISAVLTFWPSLLVYAIFHLIADYPMGWHLLWCLPIILLLAVITTGLTIAIATLNVYFRDVASFLPYVTRIWLYLTPIIYLYENIPQGLRAALYFNPIGTLFAAWQQVLFEGRPPDLGFLAMGAFWSALSLGAGVLTFLRREREFAVRI